MPTFFSDITACNGAVSWSPIKQSKQQRLIISQIFWRIKQFTHLCCSISRVFSWKSRLLSKLMASFSAETSLIYFVFFKKGAAFVVPCMCHISPLKQSPGEQHWLDSARDWSPQVWQGSSSSSVWGVLLLQIPQDKLTPVMNCIYLI